ncbi:MAG: hypothetical protein AAF513_10510 [Pseudomonadota bacterium]
MDVTTLLSFLLSIFAVVLLAFYDPKRKRHLRGRASVRWWRRGLALLLFLPGVFLATQGKVSTLLIWIGVVSVAGWVAAWLVNLSARAAD